MKIGFVIFPNITQLDMTGAAQFLSRMPNAQCYYLWKDKAPIKTDCGFEIIPTHNFDEAPQMDILLMPGGFGIWPLLNDEVVLDFLRAQEPALQYLCSVCNGSLVLGAAGLLKGYNSACHWAWGHKLQEYGANFVAQRVVQDRNRFSGGGVTAGIDFALTLFSKIAGDDAAKLVQLGLEYDPAPPFDYGSPNKASAQMKEKIIKMNKERLEKLYSELPK